MKKFFALVAIMTFVLTAAVVAADEQVKPLTFEDIKGTWNGNWKDDYQNSLNDQGPCTVSFNKASGGKKKIRLIYTGEYGRHEAKVVIRDDTVYADTKSRHHELKLYKKSNGKLILKGRYTRIRVAAQTSSSTLMLER